MKSKYLNTLESVVLSNSTTEKSPDIVEMYQNFLSQFNNIVEFTPDLHSCLHSS